MRRTERLVERCRLLMAIGEWWTIQNMAAARIRDQRKAKYGRHKIVKRPIGGVFEYRMVPIKEKQRV